MGLVTMAQVAQVVPVNCSVRVWMAPLSCWVWPTAQMSLALTAVMAFSRLPSPPRLGVLVRDHLVPFQWASRCWVALGCDMFPASHALSESCSTWSMATSRADNESSPGSGCAT